MGQDEALHDALAKVVGSLPRDLVVQSLEHLVLLQAVDTWPNGEPEQAGILYAPGISSTACVWGSQRVAVLLAVSL
jgi:hypothetical protein